MVELPEGAPLGLSWFVAWVGLSVALAFVNRQLRDEDGQLEAEVEHRSRRAIDHLNENMQRELQLLGERPVNDRASLSDLYRWVSDAWNPRARFERFQQLGRLARIFCAIQFVAGLVVGAAWWAIEDGRATIAVVGAIVFAIILLLIACCIAYRIWAHVVLSHGVADG